MFQAFPANAVLTELVRNARWFSFHGVLSRGVTLLFPVRTGGMKVQIKQCLRLSMTSHDILLINIKIFFRGRDVLYIEKVTAAFPPPHFPWWRHWLHRSIYNERAAVFHTPKKALTPTCQQHLAMWCNRGTLMYPWVQARVLPKILESSKVIYCVEDARFKRWIKIKDWFKINSNKIQIKC